MNSAPGSQNYFVPLKVKQPELPFGPDALHRWSVVMSRKLPLSAEFLLTKTGAEIRLVGQLPDGEMQLLLPRLFQINVKPRAQLSGLGTSRRDLHGPDERNQWDDSVVESVYDDLFRIHHRSIQEVQVNRLLEPSMVSVFDHLERLFDRSAWSLACGFAFGRGMRWFVYESIVNDPSARLAQMAATCPGLLIAARFLQMRGVQNECCEILEGIEMGKRRVELLTLAASAIATLGQREHGASKEDLRSLRLFIQKAGPLVPLWVFQHAEPSPFIPDDIPTQAQKNAHWFKTLSMVGAVLERGHRLSDVQRRGLIALISGDSELFEDRFESEEFESEFPAVLRWFLDFLSATGTVLTRATSSRKVVGACSAWHDSFWVGPGVSHFLPEMKLAVQPLIGLERWSYGNATITFLPTVGDLQLESSRMQHCVATYADSAVSGDCYVFHGKFVEEHVTIAVSLKPTLRLLERSGVRNKEPSNTALSLIATWLAAFSDALQTRSDGNERKFKGSFSDAVDTEIGAGK